MKIIICKECNGKGVIDERVSAYDTEKVKCLGCQGSGRLVEEVVYKPYFPQPYSEE